MSKKYVVEYSLTFYNTLEVEAESKRDARKKFRAIEDERGELNALDGVENGYRIEGIYERE